MASGPFEPALSGSHAALKEFFEQQCPRVERAIRRVFFGPKGLFGRLCTREDVLDVRQRTFEVLFQRGGERLRNYDPSRGMSPESWIEWCARQQANNFLDERYARKRGGPLGEIPTAPDDLGIQLAESDAPTPEELIELAQRWSRVEGRLGEVLTPKERLAFRFLFAEELSIDEVCAVMAISRDDAYQLRHRIKAKLKKLLDEQSEGEPG